MGADVEQGKEFFDDYVFHSADHEQQLIYDARIFWNLQNKWHMSPW